MLKALAVFKYSMRKKMQPTAGGGRRISYFREISVHLDVVELRRCSASLRTLRQGARGITNDVTLIVVWTELNRNYNCVPQQVCMMSDATESMIGNNRTMPNIKQEIDNPTTPTQNYQVCSPTTTLQHQEVSKLNIERSWILKNRLWLISHGEGTRLKYFVI